VHTSPRGMERKCHATLAGACVGLAKYSSRSVKWKIYSTGNILTQRDGCMTASGTLLND
jgi:hypothetical protein